MATAKLVWPSTPGANIDTPSKRNRDMVSPSSESGSPPLKLVACDPRDSPSETGSPLKLVIEEDTPPTSPELVSAAQDGRRVQELIMAENAAHFEKECTSVPPSQTNEEEGWQKASPKHRKKPTKATEPMWVFMTFFVVGMIAPQKLQQACSAFKARMGKDADILAQNQGPKGPKAKRSFRTRVRSHRIDWAQSFTFPGIDFNTQTDSKPTKTKKSIGIMEIPTGMNFEQVKQKVQSDPNVGYIKKGRKNNKNNTITIECKSDKVPQSINGLSVRPAEFSILRCLNCQMFGHSTSTCRNPTKCPHCAQNHTHADCKNTKAKKCANCNKQHSAAYKGCNEYLKYSNKVMTKNQTIRNQYPIAIPTLTKPKQINLETVAKSMVGKTEQEILTILKAKFGPAESTPTNSQAPIVTRTEKPATLTEKANQKDRKQTSTPRQGQTKIARNSQSEIPQNSQNSQNERKKPRKPRTRKDSWGHKVSEFERGDKNSSQNPKK